jgi:hypothetical protein
MSDDAALMLGLLRRSCRGRIALRLAEELGWRHGAEFGNRSFKGQPGKSTDIDGNRALRACRELEALGLAQERRSAKGSRWSAT